MAWRMMAVAAVSVLAAGAASMAGWTDRKEYDLVLKIRVEASPEKQLELLNQWKQQYPQSEMRQVRRELFLAAYQAMNDTGHMFETAREMVAEQPANLVGVYWCTLLTPAMKDAKPDVLETGNKAAHQLLAGLDNYFAASQKPEALAAADWQKQKAAAELLALRTIGYVQWKTADNAGAEKTFTAYLAKDAKSAEVMSWLGYALVAQNQPVAAAWQLTRAAASQDEEALPDIWRRKVDETAELLYRGYHGSDDGFEQLKAGALKSAFPPADFQVESAEAVNRRKAEEELEKQDPELAAWLRISRRLHAADGEKYFVDELKPQPLPWLRGVIVESTPTAKPSQIVLTLSSSATSEVMLTVSAPFANAAEPGTMIEFQGTADTFVKDPFRLNVLVDQDNVKGWPDAKKAKK